MLVNALVDDSGLCGEGEGGDGGDDGGGLHVDGWRNDVAGWLT